MCRLYICIILCRCIFGLENLCELQTGRLEGLKWCLLHFTRSLHFFYKLLFKKWLEGYILNKPWVITLQIQILKSNSTCVCSVFLKIFSKSAASLPLLWLDMAQVIWYDCKIIYWINLKGEPQKNFKVNICYVISQPENIIFTPTPIIPFRVWGEGMKVLKSDHHYRRYCINKSSL